MGSMHHTHGHVLSKTESTHMWHRRLRSVAAVVPLRAKHSLTCYAGEAEALFSIRVVLPPLLPQTTRARGQWEDFNVLEAFFTCGVEAGGLESDVGVVLRHGHGEGKELNLLRANETWPSLLY